MLSRSFVVLLSVLLLAGCAAAPTPAPESTPSADAALTAESVFAEVEVIVGPDTVNVEVHPPVRSGEMTVLTLDVSVEDDASGTLSKGVLDAVAPAWSGLVDGDWAGLRLFSTFSDTVMPVAVDADGATVVARSESGAGASERIHLAFRDANVAKVDLFIPQGGIVHDIPVIWEGEPVADGSEQLDLASISSAVVSPIVLNSVDLASSTRTDADANRAIIALGADFLFGFDSAELSADARVAIEAAAAQIEQRTPGVVEVVGHTDAVGDDAYNQTLSEQRAAAVAAVLTELIDTDAYPLAVSGVGESAPVALDDTEEGRAQNRRVELTIATAPLGASQSEVSDEQYKATGPVGTGAKGVIIDSEQPVKITAPRAYTLGGRIVVELHTELLGSSIDPAVFEGTLAGPPGLDAVDSMSGVAVLEGSLATRPMLYQPIEEMPDVLFPMTDLSTLSQMKKGDVRTSVVIYPFGPHLGDTVTLQLLTNDDSGWRLTDIPLEKEEGY